MTYILNFKHNGKFYSHYQRISEKYTEKQYEAAAVGLLLTKLEQEYLPKEDKYTELCLIELDEKVERVHNPVWAADAYVPYSCQIK